jgi:hypothetical protein
MADLSRLVSKRLPLLPQRQVPTGPRNGSQLPVMARQVSDAFYRCTVEIAKVIYTQIDARLKSDPSFKDDHQARMEEARKILNEARNDVAEGILPRFDVELRRDTSDEEPTKSDEVAHDYILKNVFDHTMRTFKAYSDLFVAAQDVATLDKVIDKVAIVQRERLEGWLVNYKFTAKVIVSPAQEKEAADKASTKLRKIR